MTDATAWLEERGRAHRYEVERVPLGELDRWHLGDELAHDTRRFFTIRGLAVATSFGRVSRWMQPIIDQPEIGILGFLVKRIDGELHVLAQAKMEPGNRVMVQLTPTVQATPSNYERVHGGRATPFIERFLSPTSGRVLVDLLLSEQGSRYERKRNRNMIVEIDDDPPLEPDYAWVALSQIHGLLARGDAVNMNARSVLSTLQREHDEVREVDVSRMLAWLADRRAEIAMDVERVPLGKLDRWICDRESIRHADGRFFRIIGVATRAAHSREVGAWNQPMLEPMHAGTVALIGQRRAGQMEYLVQARAEPGYIDRVELGATIQVSPGNYAHTSDLPPFAELLGCPPGWVRFRAPQADDGGRFFHDSAMHLVIELPEDERVDVPKNYTWATTALLKELMRYGVVNIEARSLVACIS